MYMNVFLTYIHTYIHTGGFSGPMNTIPTEQNIQHQLLRIPTGRRQASWLFASAAEKLTH